MNTEIKLVGLRLDSNFMLDIDVDKKIGELINFVNNYELKTFVDMSQKVKFSMSVNNHYEFLITGKPNFEIVDDITERNISHRIENFIFHLFFIANIAVPGILELYNAQVLVGNNKSRKINMWASMFSIAMEKSLDEKWPTIKILDFMDVNKWYSKFNFMSRQKALNNTETAIFAIMQVAAMEHNDISNVIKYSLALEAIYNLPSYQIVQILINRIFMLLGEPSHNKKKHKKDIREFYDLRSRIAHGNFKINHPYNNSLLDDSVEEIVVSIINSENTVMKILLATIQTMISKNIHRLNYEEIEKHETL